jgi:hypothetical protein
MMKLKYWILTLAIAVAVAAGGTAISQEEESETPQEATTPLETTTPVFLVACFSTSKPITGSNTLTAINFESVVESSENFPSCGKLTRLVINGTIE